MKPWQAVGLALLAGVLVGLVVGYWGAVQHVTPALERWHARGDSMELAIQVGELERTQQAAELTRYQAVVDSLAARAVPLPPERQPVPQNLPNVGTASDSAAFWEAEATAARKAAEQLQQDNAVLRQEADRRQAQLEATGRLLALSRSADSLHTAQRDSLRALRRDEPDRRARGIAFLGIRICPVIGPSYSVVPGVGQGFGASVTQPLSCGRE